MRLNSTVSDVSNCWDSVLFSRIVRGFKKQVRPKLRPEFPDGGKPLTDAVSHEAEQLAGKQIRRFERELDKIEVKQHHI